MHTAHPAHAPRANSPQSNAAPIPQPARALPSRVTARTCFDGALELFDHGHIQRASHARLFKTGLLCMPGHAPQTVAVRFFNFQFNAMQDRLDAVYSVWRDGQRVGEFFASAFKHLWL